MEKIILVRREKPPVERRRTVNIKPEIYTKLQRISHEVDIPIEALVNDFILKCLPLVEIVDSEGGDTNG